MANEPLNSPENVNLPHGVQLWFQENFDGPYVEFGDLLIDEINVSPEFLEHFSYHDGLRAKRKQLVTQRTASLTATLFEPSILNLQRMLFGGTISKNNSKIMYESRQVELQQDTGAGLYIDIASMDPKATVADVVVLGIFELNDPREERSLHISNGGVPDSNSRVSVSNGTDNDAEVGDTVYCKYTIDVDGLYKTELFGADEATIEGAAQLHSRNQSGGIMQLWDIASLAISPNGGIPFPIDAIQTLPLLGSFQERGGTFGSIFTK